MLEKDIAEMLENMNLMRMKFGSLFVIIGKRLDELKIPLMVEENTENTKCQFTVSVDHKDVSSGISADERALTIKKIIDKNTKPEDFLRPGHMFPLKSSENGVLERQGHTEAAVDLCKLAGLQPIAVIAEIMNDDGTMAKLPDLEEFAKKHKLSIYTIKDLIEYRKSNVQN